MADQLKLIAAPDNWRCDAKRPRSRCSGERRMLAGIWTHPVLCAKHLRELGRVLVKAGVITRPAPKRALGANDPLVRNYGGHLADRTGR